MDKLIWRVVGRDGKGPYNCCDELAYRSSNIRRYVGDGHPGPHYDKTRDGTPIGDFWTPLRHFGFASVTAARRWFPQKDDLKNWAKLGAKLRVWKASDLKDVHKTRNQAVFYIPHSAPYADLDLTDLHSKSAADLKSQALDQIAFKVSQEAQ